MEFIKKINLTEQIKKIEFTKVINEIKMLIPEKLKNPETWATLVRRLIYIVCFVWFCKINQTIDTVMVPEQDAVRNYTILIMGFISLTAYRFKDFIKTPYFLWIVGFFLMKDHAMDWARENAENLGRYEANAWIVGIYGLLAIRMFYLFVMERKRPRMNWPFFGVWLAMMLGMVFSANDETWFLWFFLAFGVFYLTDYSQKQLNTLFSGMVEGIIISFLYLQFQALLHRPYDTIRYTGMYENCNMNALFYVVSYLAVLGKWYLMKLKQRNFLLQIPLAVLAGVLWALTVFTMCRTALISMAVFTVLFVVFQVISRKKGRVLEFVVDCAMLLLAIILTFEPTYNLVRYIPAYNNDPIYFAWESKTKKIQVDEAFDSEKYVEFDEMMEEAFGRIANLKGILGKSVSNILFPPLQVHAAENGDQPSYIFEDVGAMWEELRGTDPRYPMLENPKDGNDSVKIREAIWEYYCSHFNLRGHNSEQNQVWVTATYLAPHAHNMFIQIAYDHGILVGLLFIAVIGMTAFMVVRAMYRHRQGALYYRMFMVAGILVIFVTFGMFEICWRFGHVSFILLFMAFRVMCHRDEPKRITVEKGK
ncbi:MAG: hypothetical protein IJ282_04815 [Lachnospiraceae bacterium]|nr:hypothetical protein [Lachnospiraceae bacterium]